MAASMTLIAKEAGVSRPLVSRLFNSDSTLRISEETKQHVFETAEKLGGVKRRQVSVRKNGTIVLPIGHDFSVSDFKPHNISNQYVRVITDAAAAKKYRFSIMPFDKKSKMEFFNDMCAPSSFCSGLFLTTSIVDQKVADLLLKRNFPHVCIDSKAEIYEINTVSTYALSGYRKAIKHLMELGHKRIGYLGPQRSRYPAFLSAMFESGLQHQVDDNCKYEIADGKTRPEDYRAAAADAFGKWINAGGKATAMICHNDYGALGAIDAMHSLGMIPGREISLIGFDNIEERRSDFKERPGITTIDNPRTEIYKRAVDVLYRQMINRGEQQIVHEHFPLELVLRTTTGVVSKNEK